jgi:hypothetical protein
VAGAEAAGAVVVGLEVCAMIGALMTSAIAGRSHDNRTLSRAMAA